MLRPQRGEGERSYRNKRKAPQIALTVLIFSTPLCLAESAMATSSFGQLSESLPQQQRLQTEKQSLANNFLGQKPRTIRSSITPIELQADITALESTLAQYQSTLSSLKKKSPLDPSLSASLNETIRGVEAKVSALQILIATAKKELATYQKAQQSLAEAISSYNKAQANKNQQNDRVLSATTALTQATTELDLAKATADASLTNLNLVKAKTAIARVSLSSADASLTTQIGITNNALTALNNAKAVTAQASSLVTTAQEALTSASTALSNATSNKSQAQSAYDTALINLEQAHSAFEIAQSNLQQAQSAYDNNLIPDPNWTVPTQLVQHTRLVPQTRTVTTTTLVPHETTTLQEQVIPNILFNSDFSRGTEGWSGVLAGWQGSNPALVDGEVIFSYQNQTVSQGLFSGPFQNATLTLSADWLNNDLNRGITDTYSMTVEARDINQNPVGTATYTSTGSHEWENKSVTLTATGPVSYITVSFTGIDSGFWYGIYGPHFKNPTLSISHGQMVTETTYEEVTTTEEITEMVEEIYYTTEPITTEGTIQVKINEGGQATFTAPQGAVFVSSDLRYEAIDRPECGVDIQPNVNGLSQVTIQSLNSVWGDPCGGWYKHITGTLTYLGQPTAPLIKDPALLPAVQEAQDAYDIALSNKESAQLTFAEKDSELNNAISVYDLALSNKVEGEAAVASAEAELTTAQQNQDAKDLDYVEAVSDQTKATLSKSEAEVNLANAIDEEEQAQQDFNNKTQAVATAQSTKDQATEDLATEEANLQVALESESVALATKSEAEDSLTSAEDTATQSYSLASNATDISFTDVEQILNTPLPVPEEGSKEIPVDLSAENLMEVNLETVDPTELTEEQAEQLKEAALETFETAEQGSPEYEQALDALYLAAEQDDIELPAELAAIPGLAGAVEVLNFLGNAGADMSPQVREQSEKVVVTAVVAAGVAVQAAAGAATSAAVSASAPSGGSSGGGSRRVGK